MNQNQNNHQDRNQNNHQTQEQGSAEQEVKIIHTMGQNNCGGRCIINAHVQDGKIIKITTDTSEGTLEHPPLRACARGLNYHKTYLSDKRLSSPLLRVGERGSGEFKEISWEEAIDRISSEWIRIRDTYGPGSRYVNYGWGVSAMIRPLALAKRLLALDGGYLDYYNSYSTACVHYTTPYLYGTKYSGNSFSDLLNSKLIILWGHNPAETVFDNLMFYLRKAKEKGIPIICVDPRYHDTAKILKAEWIPLRPTTDAALMDAMAYVIKEQGLYDQKFMDTFCQGFTRDTMPKGYEKAENYFDYLDGNYDGIPKTPEWGAAITGVDSSVIKDLAIRYADRKPAALIQGYGPQRNRNGEQTVRGGIALACLTGNVGISGGWACGSGCIVNPPTPEIPEIENPYPGKISVFTWTQAIEEGISMGKKDGVKGMEHLDSNIKMIMNLAGNVLMNQHADLHRTEEILKDTSKCEFIVVSDLFMTASARYADIVLPGVSFLEMNNITDPWTAGDFIGCNRKVVEPLPGCRPEYEWLKEVADRLGLYDAFTEGHETSDEWLRDEYNRLREKESELPDYDAFQEAGIYRFQNRRPVIAFQEQREDFSNHPFATPSGKIEIFSPVLYDMEETELIPGIPKYVPAHEGPQDPLQREYPLQLIGYHTKRRCHTIHETNEAMETLDPQAVWMNPADAKERDIQNGDLVTVWNPRGTMRIKAKVTSDIMPGVAAISQGAWYTPDQKGVDTRGSINVLTSLEPSPLAKGNAQHTNLVQVKKYQ